MTIDIEPASRRIPKNLVILICSLWVGWGVGYGCGMGCADMAPLVDAGLTELVSNAQQLCSALESATSPLDRSRIDGIWTKDSHARFCEAMKAIL
ncbi:MAG: hypothetical protein MUC50_21125 [Myxococcota bacterium]|nr:hypothetical protein [Myxococcota bacterium]